MPATRTPMTEFVVLYLDPDFYAAEINAFGGVIRASILNGGELPANPDNLPDYPCVQEFLLACEDWGTLEVAADLINAHDDDQIERIQDLPHAMTRRGQRITSKHTLRRVLTDRRVRIPAYAGTGIFWVQVTQQTAIDWFDAVVANGDLAVAIERDDALDEPLDLTVCDR